MNIEYTVQIWKEGGQFIAHAMPLDVMSSGPTPEDAGHALDEAVRLFLLTAADMNTLDDILQESGFKFQQGKWISPSWISTQKHSMAVGF